MSFLLFFTTQNTLCFSGDGQGPYKPPVSAKTSLSSQLVFETSEKRLSPWILFLRLSNFCPESSKIVGKISIVLHWVLITCGGKFGIDNTQNTFSVYSYVKTP